MSNSDFDNMDNLEENFENVSDLEIIPMYDNLDDKENFAIRKISQEELDNMPLLVIREDVFYPGIPKSIIVARPMSVELINVVKKTGALFAIVSQKEPQNNNPNFEDLHRFGVIATLEKVFSVPNSPNKLSVIIKGHQRIELNELNHKVPFYVGSVSILKDLWYRKSGSMEMDATIDMLKKGLGKIMYAENPELAKEVSRNIKNVRNPLFLSSYIASRLTLTLEKKQEILSTDSVLKRSQIVLKALEDEASMIDIKIKVINKTRTELEQQQKEFYINQQIKNLQQEIGENSQSDASVLRDSAKTKNWADYVAKTFEKEVQKLERLHVSSPDYSIQLQYCQTILSLPWNDMTVDDLSIENAEKILDKHHFGMEKVKERILEYLSVLKLKGDLKTPILCLYGPPGVGKTSIGKSIAESLGRKYIRISLGGLSDESEIRGHRRTYIGSMMGRIMSAINKAGKSNPVFILDEIDKISYSYKGDPSAALLEVLDPEQNKAFHDNYLDIDYDLSKVLFVATANDINSISRPLRDRMEMVEVSGYIEQEKCEIAKKYLIPKIAEDHGLKEHQLKLDDEAIAFVVENYTRESGVRALSNKLSEIARKIAKRVAVENSDLEICIRKDDIEGLLGRKIFYRTDYQGNDFCGVVTGLAWTSVGGEILFIESSLHRGTELKLILTGNIGDVMKESATIALNYVRAHIEELGIDYEYIKNKEIHIHIPEGAIPKDGPSAGITMATSIVSAMTKRKVKDKIAMTGELTLTGKVLPVGGIKEKILAAKRSGINEIILCAENKRNIEEISEKYTKDMIFHYVEDLNQVLDIAITDEISIK